MSRIVVVPAAIISPSAPVGAPSSARSAPSRGKDAASTNATLWSRVLVSAVVEVPDHDNDNDNDNEIDVEPVLPFVQDLRSH